MSEAKQLVVTQTAPVVDYTPEQEKLIRDTVAKGATESEFQLFMYRARNMMLDPLKPGQIHFVKYGASPGTIVVGIDGFRARAGRTGKHVGTKRGVLRDDKGKCIGAWAEIYRADWREPAREEVSLAEYNTGRANWQKMPETMIKKVAEAAALRMAFPDELGGLYTHEEMEQAEQGRQAERAEVIHATVTAPQPKPAAALSPGDYVIRFGQFAGKRIAELTPEQVSDCIAKARESEAKNKTPLAGQVKDCVEAMEAFLKQ